MQVLEKELDQILEAAKEVAKAEGGRLEHELRHRARQGSLLFAAMIAAGTAFFFAVVAAYSLLSDFIGPVAAGLVVSVASLLLGAFLAMLSQRPPSGSAELRGQLSEEKSKRARLELELRVRDFKDGAFGLIRHSLGIGRVAWEALMALGERLLKEIIGRRGGSEPATPDSDNKPAVIDDN